MITKKLIVKKPSITKQVPESIFLHEVSIYTHFMLTKIMQSAMLKFMALGRAEKIEHLTKLVTE